MLSISMLTTAQGKIKIIQLLNTSYGESCKDSMHPFQYPFCQLDRQNFIQTGALDYQSKNSLKQKWTHWMTSFKF
uniref:Uncharacterized protein n=1 Tax=Amphimedon queenslandica TaxID=400682 RepID=A0A1X7VA89_AMPQE